MDTQNYFTKKRINLVVARKFALLFFFFGAVFGLQAQLTLEQCQAKAKANYPQIKQYGLIEQSKAYNLENAGKSWLPQLTLNARTTYQSEVTEVPVNIPSVEVPKLSKDQYQLTAEVNQTLWDGGATRTQKKTIETGSQVENQKLEVDLYALKERVNGLYFGILLIDKQLSQNEVFATELKNNYDKIESFMANGVANQADLDAVRVEQLNNIQRRSELQIMRQAYSKVLSAMIGENIAEGSTLLVPADLLVETATIKRPELDLFRLQSSLLEVQKENIQVRNRPKLGAFLQGGYGQPGLNMFKEGFSPYFIGGVRASWSIGNYYTSKNDERLIEINKQNIETQKETFLFNTNLLADQQRSEIEKFKTTLANDDEIIRLRHNIKTSAEAKMENGTLSVTDYLREVNAEETAKQAKSLHEIQLLMAVYNLKNTVNN